MNAKDIAKMMDILRVAYPGFYKYKTISDEKKAIALWSELFEHDDGILVLAAVKSFIESDEKGYPPHIGAIKAKMRLLVDSDELTEQEAWNIVSRAIKNSGYDSKEEFSKFPEIIKRIVGSPTQLKEWAMMDSEIVQSVVASNFQRSYRHIYNKKDEISKLPKDILCYIQTFNEKKRLK